MQPDVPAAGGSVCELCGEGAYGNMSGDRALALVRPAKLDGWKLVTGCTRLARPAVRSGTRVGGITEHYRLG